MMVLYISYFTSNNGVSEHIVNGLYNILECVFAPVPSQKKETNMNVEFNKGHFIYIFPVARANNSAGQVKVRCLL